jgi:hypothetical protein
MLSLEPPSEACFLQVCVHAVHRAHASIHITCTGYLGRMQAVFDTPAAVVAEEWAPGCTSAALPSRQVAVTESLQGESHMLEFVLLTYSEMCTKRACLQLVTCA